MRLSVCIPTHHGRCELLAQTLESIAAQAVPPGVELEVVVSDNVSHDGTDGMVAAFAARHPELVVVYGRNDRDIRLGNIMRVIERASGDWCWFFGSDDIMVPGAIEAVAAVIALHPQAAGIGVRRADFDFTMQQRLPGEVPEAVPLERDLTVFSDFRTIVDRLAFVFGFLGSNVVRRELWLEVARERGDAALAAHVDWPQLIVLGEMARRNPTWVWLPTTFVQTRGGRSYLVEGEGELPNLARFHVVLVDGLRAAWRELAGDDRRLYRALIERTAAVTASRTVVHHIKLSSRHGRRWDVRLLGTFVRTFWWMPAFRREVLPLLLLTPARYRRRVTRRAGVAPTPVLDADACRVRLTAALPADWWAREMLQVPCRIRNDGPVPLSSVGEHPVHLGARWFTPDGADVLDGPRATLPRGLAAGESAEVLVSVPVPWDPGDFRLRLDCVQENVRWFSDADPANGVVCDVTVRLLRVA